MAATNSTTAAERKYRSNVIVLKGSGENYKAWKLSTDLELRSDDAVWNLVSGTTNRPDVLDVPTDADAATIAARKKAIADYEALNWKALRVLVPLLSETIITKG